MIVELVDESDELIGKFQSPAVPRPGETISYAGNTHVVEDIAWFVETDHDQHVERIRIEVRPAEE